MLWHALSVLLADPCLTVIPPCMNEDDRFSLDALRHIHKQLDDDNDGGIEVNESVEVRRPCYACSANTHQFSSVTQLTFWPGFYLTLDYAWICGNIRFAHRFACIYYLLWSFMFLILSIELSVKLHPSSVHAIFVTGDVKHTNTVG